MKDESVYIRQILDSISKLESFVAGLSRGDLASDQKTQSAVILQLLLIGEISKKISDETKQKVDVPWKEIAGFRDMAAHHYFDVDLDVVWATLQEDVPSLKQRLSEHLSI